MLRTGSPIYPKDGGVPSEAWFKSIRDEAEQLQAALLSDELKDRVEFVLRRLGANTYGAFATDGSVTFERIAMSGHYEYKVLDSLGRNPLEDQSLDRFLGFDVEQDHSPPVRTENSYPYALDSVAQFFDSPVAPDLFVNHTAAHDTDGNLGQHGSLQVTQARAPFIAAGAGIRPLGVIDRALRMVDVAPTLAATLDLDPHPDAVGPTGDHRSGALLGRQDGDIADWLLDGGAAKHVVVILLDGCNANLLSDVIASGDAPNLAGLAARGTSLRYGLMASLPTATLANHTAAVTGAHPGHSGVLNHTWYNRSTGEIPDLLSMDEMFWAMKHLDPKVETIFGAVKRSRPEAFTSATFEFCDREATMSSFAMVRSGASEALPDISEVRHADPESVSGSDTYSFMSSVDHLSMTHTLECWRRKENNVLPTLSWCSLSVTDEAAHESGPHGSLARAAVVDSDARVGEILAEVERAGVMDDTAVFVISDHGMEQADPTVTDSWGAALTATGISHLDVGGGLIYLTRGRTHTWPGQPS